LSWELSGGVFPGGSGGLSGNDFCDDQIFATVITDGRIRGFEGGGVNRRSQSTVGGSEGGDGINLNVIAGAGQNLFGGVFTNGVSGGVTV